MPDGRWQTMSEFRQGMELATLDKAVYYAPRGRRRLLHLGGLIASRYLHPDDLLIGLVGDAGAGKSLLIRGMFPGLVLTNDDEGINVRPLPLLRDFEDERFDTSTYHVDIRFEMAFTQPWNLGEAIRVAVRKGRRVVVEHWDLIYPFVGAASNILIGIGEEVIVTRPSVFGPEPKSIADHVFRSLKYRKMAHSAEDLTSLVLEDMGIEKPQIHSDVRHGFVIEFERKPQIDFDEVERRVMKYIEDGIQISYCDEEHINVGGRGVVCSGPRIHVSNAGEVEGFCLMKDLRYDPLTGLYLLVGLVGSNGSIDCSV